MLLQMALFHSFYLVSCSLTKPYPTLYDLLDCSTPGSCPPLWPGVCSNSCPLSRWCYPTISPSAAPFSFCFQSFPASGSFPMNWLFTSGGQSVGASVSASVLPMNIQGWFPLGLTGWYPSSSLTLGLPIISVDHLLSPCNQLLQVIAFLTMPPQMWTQVPPQRTKDD